MHITLESDYAIRIVLYLLQHEGRSDAKKIAENTNVTLRFSLKILRKLVGAGLVRSYKGATGGYEAARKPEEISLADVMEVTEGTYCLSRCLESTAACAHGGDGYCKVQKVFGEISSTVRQKLVETTFDKLICEEHHHS
ncbi:MAG: RrF2 family transcriptional regulator [Candidatus Merdivicinus sp.]|jgi:Rrf2 family protein